MLKIKGITIENFRGIKLPLTINFYKGGKANSVAIYGRNGTGKSSIVDAWEWTVSSEIKYLMKEGISTSDFPHKTSKGENSYVKVDLLNPNDTFAKAEFNKSKITTPTISGDFDYLKNHSIYPNYLRYADLQEFVYLSKTDKYKFIAKYFGLEKFTKNQSELQGSITRLMQQERSLSANLSTNLGRLKAICGTSAVDETSIISFVNVIAKKHKIPEVTSFNGVNTVLIQLNAIVKANPVSKALVEWQAFLLKLNKFYPLTSLESDCKQLEAAYTDLKKDEKNITKLILTELYNVSLSAIPQLEDKTKCPLCDKTFEGDFIAHITEKHSALSSLHKIKEDYDSKKEAIGKALNGIIKKISVIEAETSTIVLTALSSFFDDLKELNTSAPALLKIVSEQLKNIQKLEISSHEAILTIEKLFTDEPAIRGEVNKEIGKLSTDANTKNLANDFSLIKELSTLYPEYLKSKGKVEYIEGIIKNANSLLNELTAYIQTQIQNVFTSIQADLVDYYGVLEDGNTFLKNPVIKLVTGKDKAVELEIEFVTERITPAFKFMSESQINSFGLSIFLAAVKFFNSDFKFIILDDVVNSFDAFKRPRVAKLLASKFQDFQILMLTHDQIFFELIQKTFPAWERYKFVSWDYTTGPKYQLSKNYIEDIQELIDNDEPDKAGQKLGKYLEWTIGSINEKLRTPMPYKIDNIYTLGELYDPMLARLKDKVKKANFSHKLLKEFDDFEIVFRNYSVHWKNESNPFTAPEIDAIFKKWLLIENILYCEKCKAFAEISTTSGEIKCQCGALNLKDSTFYDSL